MIVSVFPYLISIIISIVALKYHAVLRQVSGECAVIGRFYNCCNTYGWLQIPIVNVYLRSVYNVFTICLHGHKPSICSV